MKIGDWVHNRADGYWEMRSINFEITEISNNGIDLFNDRKDGKEMEENKVFNDIKDKARNLINEFYDKKIEETKDMCEEECKRIYDECEIKQIANKYLEQIKKDIEELTKTKKNISAYQRDDKNVLFGAEIYKSPKIQITGIEMLNEDEQDVYNRTQYKAREDVRRLCDNRKRYLDSIDLCENRMQVINVLCKAGITNKHGIIYG